MNTNAPQHGHRPGSGKPDATAEKNVTQASRPASVSRTRLPQKPFNGTVPAGRAAIVKDGIIVGVK